MNKHVFIGSLLAFSVGCAQFPTDPYWQAEAAWQTGHAIDVLQTINGPARDDCFYEADPFTKRLIGENPSTSDVVVWGVATGALHYGVSKALVHYNAPKWVKVGWHGISLTTKAYTVVDNHNKGIRPWGNNVSDCNGIQGIDNITIKNN